MRNVRAWVSLQIWQRVRTKCGKWVQDVSESQVFVQMNWRYIQKEVCTWMFTAALFLAFFQNMDIQHILHRVMDS
jgi:hypothetical protein